ncbi:adenylate/guanylate cyclase domain-containing protein [Flavobacterium sp.]|uniref:adenylate/guanylate cyclase domain-containing protein n=1 Tax=Flavobacterium sp. TaxID=239 RepID=UPI00286AC4BB|nr:adenylate/guanylate cyclase domain-containing protein [Flavobacterium sp.]
MLQSYVDCKEINIVGDSVWAIFEYSTKDDVMNVFQAAYSSVSIIRNLNYKLCHKGIDPIKIGIGIDKGQALMVLAGFKSSGINDVIYMGGVVNKASKLCNKGNKNGINEIVISQVVYDDLNGFKGTNDKLYQDMLTKNYTENFYHGSVIRTSMEDWLNEQKQKKPCNPH